MLKGALHNDIELAVSGAIGVGFLTEDDSEKLQQCFFDLTQLAIEPWLDKDDPRANKALLDDNGHYLWGHSDLPTRITKKAGEYALTFKNAPTTTRGTFFRSKDWWCIYRAEGP